MTDFKGPTDGAFAVSGLLG